MDGAGSTRSEGIALLRWVKKITGSHEPLSPAAPEMEQVVHTSHIEALSEAVSAERGGTSEAIYFVIENLIVDQSTSSPHLEEYIEHFILNMNEVTLRRIVELSEDHDISLTVRRMCALTIAYMSQKFRERKGDVGIDYTDVHNIILLGEDFYRSYPQATDSYGLLRDPVAVRGLTVRFNFLMKNIKEQNLSRVPDFSKLSPDQQYRARVVLVIANTFYTGASDEGSRHRESDLLQYVDDNFERRFEIAEILSKHPSANPSLIDEILHTDVMPLRDGFL